MTALLTRADIIDTEQFLMLRQQQLPDMMQLKKIRRVSVGDLVMLYFENRTTLWWQIQEMLRVERGGEEQIADELDAYNPLIPQGQELVATLMIEIPDPQIRTQKLYAFTHIESQVALRFAGHTILATPEQDVERTRADGKTSAVHFIRWTFTPAQIADFKQPKQDVIIEINHSQYTAKTLLLEATRQNLAADFV